MDAGAADQGLGQGDRGKAIGDAKFESDGKADQIEGKVRNAIGGLKDALTE